MQVEGEKCIISWGPTGAKGRPNRAEVGPGRPAQPTPVAGSVLFSLHPKDLEPQKPGRRHSTEGESHSHQEAVHKLERERREISVWGSTTSKEAPTNGQEGRRRRKGDHDQQCYV
jgi:hypothetical protein